MDETTKMTKELHLKLVAAWWDGELEFLYADCGWKPANRCPHNESEISRYRIRRGIDPEVAISKESQ